MSARGTMLDKHQEAMAAEAITLLRAAGDAEGEQRAKLLREAAGVVSDLRLTFSSSEDDFRPDVRGRSFAYRSTIADIFTRAGSDPQLRASLRYHMNNVHKRRVGETTLRAHGMSQLTRIEQNERQRHTQQAAAAIVRAQRIPGSAREKVRALDQARVLLSTMDVAKLADMEPEHRDAAAAMADAIIAVAQQVLRVTR